jgi:FkbM family methyltransferase
MPVISGIRLAAVRTLPKHWQPAVNYHYYRVRSLLDREIGLICGALRAGLRAIDVGANEGVYTHAFASTDAFVEAFEPQPAYVDVLRAYAQHHSNVRAYDVALGAAAGTGTLHVPRRDGRRVPGHARLAPVDGELASYPVKVMTLDSFGFTDVAVIKIDVEGHELDVVQGARATIARCRPLMLIEIERRHLACSMERVFDELANLGYQGQFIDPRDGGGIHTIAEFSAERHQPQSNADVAGALYINNFIFTPRENTGALVP